MLKRQPTKERTLITRLMEGDLRAFDVLYYQYESKLSGFCKKILRDDESARDVVQQVFISLWEHRADLKKVKNLDAYLFTSARNRAYNIMRRKVYEFAFQHYYKQTTAYLVNSTELEVDFNEISLLIENAVAKLPPKRKHIFEMSRYQGLNNKEIAKSLNTSTSFVENQINKALKALKVQLNHKEILGIILWIFIG